MDTAVGYSVLLRGFRLALTVEGLKPHTIENYLRDVGRFTELHPIPGKATPADVREYVLSLRERKAPKTVLPPSVLAIRRCPCQTGLR